MAQKVRLVVNGAATLMWAEPEPQAACALIERRGISALNGLGVEMCDFG